MSEARWHVVETERSLPSRPVEPGEDKADAEAVLALRRLPVEVFFPRWMVTTNHARRTRSELRPILPGYLFTRFEPTPEALAAVKGVRGVTDFLKFGEARAVIKDGEMLMFRLMFDPDGVLIVPEPESKATLMERLAERYPKGATVPIVDGVFAGYLAEIDHVDGPDRIKLLVAALGRMVETSVPAKFLGEPVSPVLRQASTVAA